MCRLEAFNDVAKRRLNQLAQKHRDTVKAYEWLRQNRNKFKGKIHGPVVMQINVKDQRYADIVESILSGENGPHLRVSTMLLSENELYLILLEQTFVCENKEDYELFTAELIDKMHLQLVVAWPDKIDQSQIETSMPLEEVYHFRCDLLGIPLIFCECSFVKSTEWSTLCRAF